MNIICNSELRSLFYFIRNPSIVLLECTNCSYRANFSISSLLKWACLLWLLNIIILGPIACGVASVVGAKHKVEFNVPLFSVAIWAPIVEEMLFRYWMVASVHFLLIMPLFILIFITGPSFVTVLLLMGLLATCFLINNISLLYKYPVMYRYSYFLFLFHAANLTFAGLHIHNFNFDTFNNFYLVPLLVLPQWCTGLILGWIRLTKGIISSIALHSIFNAVPYIAILLVLKNHN
ncbi:hypothetical protein BCUE_0322 [Candidatus Kinetoplastibacterium blastocrithidii TCC012E]|uniref:CPBP family intramembrane metalloprotease n=1 Tax=Candidatus Kinetoplastidibacterium blastocrithidiae TCC012E TaxID=1208922 RepID=M1M2Y6_9PROT|nr:hypothetical protein [Candidatus Kinetoplastibacterium blastocrithidii]AFZ83453.1 membrane protein [Candidatus Kinetoplastibacterium blastocrithidii (ex Strigomonas culicis)]AGF49549.1 hypothetical protein BCUE_0322 [Candidatus Kinetoplastibacterium blastocrithidii TCC012E]